MIMPLEIIGAVNIIKIAIGLLALGLLTIIMAFEFFASLPLWKQMVIIVPVSIFLGGYIYFWPIIKRNSIKD